MNSIGILRHESNRNIGPGSNELSLKEIAVGIWMQESGKGMDELESLHFSFGTAKSLDPALGKAIDNIIAETPPERDLPMSFTTKKQRGRFERLVGSGLGGEVQQMIREMKGLEGREIWRVSVMGGENWKFGAKDEKGYSREFEGKYGLAGGHWENM